MYAGPHRSSLKTSPSVFPPEEVRMLPNHRHTPRDDQPEPHRPPPRTPTAARRTAEPVEPRTGRPCPGPTIDLDDRAATDRERLPVLQRLRRRPLRRTVRTAALTLSAAGALLAAYALPGDNAAGPTPPSASRETAPAAPPHVQPARLIAPATATPGEHLIVLGHRDPALCGPAELRFDGLPVRHRVLRAAGARGDAYPQLFMAMDVPRSATSGTHQIELFGPVRSVQGDICGDVPEHQARIDTASISISPAQRD